MTLVAPHPTLALGVSRYPSYPQAKAYLRNFLRRGRRAYFRTKGYARFKHSLSIEVIVKRQVPAIFEVRAYPWGNLYVSTLEEALAVEEFRAWLFAYDYRTRSTYYITGSQRVGINGYKAIKRAIKKKRKLATASHSYLLR